MKYLLKLAFFFLFFFYSSNDIIGQQQDSSKALVKIDSLSQTKPWLTVFWVSLGIGSSATINDLAPAFTALFSVKKGPHFFSARVINSQGIQNITLPHEKTFDAGILYGIGFHRELWFGNASIGLAYTATTKSIFDHIDSTTSPVEKLEVDHAELFRGLGLAWQLQLFSKFSDSSDLGIGIIACGNINKSFPFWMLLFSLEFGNF